MRSPNLSAVILAAFWPCNCQRKRMRSSALSSAALPPVSHPDSRSLNRYASNEVGPRRRKIIVAHLEDCAACRETVQRVREAARKFRDFERLALIRFAEDSDRLPPSL